MELKAPAEGGPGDSPLKAMFEGLAYAAVEERFHSEFLADIETMAMVHERFQGWRDGRCTVLVVGPRSWWDVWEAYEQRGTCTWKTSLQELSSRLSDGAGPRIRFAALEGIVLSAFVLGTGELGAQLPTPPLLANVVSLPGL